MEDIYHILKKYMKSPWLFSFAVFFTTIQGITEILLPRYMGDIVNDGILTKNLDVVYSLGIRMLIVTVILGISGYIAFICINIAVLRFGNETRTGLFEKVMTFDQNQVLDIGSGSIITRLTGDVEKVISVVKVSLDLVYKPAILAIGGFLMIFSINVRFGIVFLVFILIQIAILYIFIRKTSPIFMMVQKAIDRINAKLQEILHTIRLVKSSNTESLEEKDFAERNDELYKKNIEVLSVISYFNPIVMFIMNIVIVVIVVMIGYQSREDSTTIGNVMMSITYAEQILMSIMISSNLARTISEIKPSLKRIAELEKEKISEKGTKDIEEITSLTVKNVNLKYTEDRMVFKDLSFDIKPGDSVAVVGSTSSGKTTFARLLAGMEKPSSGEVLINGTDIAEYIPEKLRRKVAVVSSSNNAIISGTYLDNLLLGRGDISVEDAKKASKAAEIDDFISSTPYGYDSLAYSSGTTISGGQRQRLMIARALAAAPDVLVLDDSTSSLDYATEAKIIDNIKKSFSETALVLITEREGSAKSCSRSFILKEGGLV